MPSETPPIVEACGLGKTYLLHGLGNSRPLFQRLGGEKARYRDAVADVNFTLNRGRALGVIGRNGSGKSTLLKLLAGVVDPTRGKAIIRGRIGALLEVGAGAHPDLSGFENMRLAARLLGVPREGRGRYYEATAQFCGLGNKLREPVRWYSSGQFARLGFAMAAMAPTDLMLVDEALAAGDAAFQLKCFDFFYAAKAEGRSFIFVSHALAVLRDLCEDGLVLQEGKAVYTGEMAGAVELYETSISED